MNNTWFNVIIGLCASSIGFLVFIDDIAKFSIFQKPLFKEKFKWLIFLKTTTFKIAIFFLATVIGIVATVEKDNYNDFKALQEQEKRDSIASKKQERRDSIAEIKRKESNNEIVSTFAKGLAIYGLKYDSSNRVIRKLVKDSALRETRFMSLARPSLEVDRILLTKISPDSITVQLKILCTQSTAYNVNLPVKYAYEERTGTSIKYLGFIDQQLAAGQDIVAQRERTIEIRMKRVDNATVFFFYINGGYSDIPELKTDYPFERLLYYDIATKKMGRIFSNNRKIVDYLNSVK